MSADFHLPLNIPLFMVFSNVRAYGHSLFHFVKISNRIKCLIICIIFRAFRKLPT